MMQWIKHKKEERMAVAAKVIGAVRLGLVDIKVVIQELTTGEMQQDAEIRMLLQESLLHNNMPSHNSKFAVEKTKPRSMSSVSKFSLICDTVGEMGTNPTIKSKSAGNDRYTNLFHSSHPIAAMNLLAGLLWGKSHFYFHSSLSSFFRYPLYIHHLSAVI